MPSHPGLFFFRLPRISVLVAAFLMFLPLSEAGTQVKSIVDLRDFRNDELKSAGFTLSQDEKVHISALGGGENKKFENWFGDDEPQLYAGGWIIDAETRESVWEMDFDNTSGRGGRRSFEGEVALSKGSYEVYFVAYAFHQRDGFSGFSINIDHRRDRPLRR
ncbi:MAG: hypothetical protein HYY49_09960, partial [Ignavibacteriales bacterium]|nr:hypothetical protein [Ignavibacteriales bacterium]